MKVGVVGAGYVGLVSAACFSEFGFNVVCIDKDNDKINKLKSNIIPIYEPGLNDLVTKNSKNNKLTFSTDLYSLADADIIFIAVGTPSARRGDGHADLKYVFQVSKDISKVIKKGKNTLIVTKSTVPIGTGKKIELLIKELRKDLIFKQDFDVASNPEFLREGSAIEDFMRPDRVICGVNTETSKDLFSELYRPLNLREAPILFTDLESAELIKYSSNAFLAMKISFINEMADLCEKVGGNVKLVAKGMGLDNRIGSKFLHPGPGFGGSCFPKDTRALLATFQDNNIEPLLIKAVVDYNENRKLRMASLIENALSGSVKGKKIAFFGVTFKPNTDDIRESPSLVIIPELLNKGALISAYDPALNLNIKNTTEFNGVNWCESIDEALTNSDALVIHTEWNEFRGLDLSNLKTRMKKAILIDLRNIFQKDIMKSIGIDYTGIGFKIERDN